MTRGRQRVRVVTTLGVALLALVTVPRLPSAGATSGQVAVRDGRTVTALPLAAPGPYAVALGGAFPPLSVADADRLRADREVAGERAGRFRSTLSAVTPVIGGYRITAAFGERGPWWSKGWHTGLDFKAPVGTTVVAAAGGVVVFAGRKGPYGRRIALAHDDGTWTTYSHLSRIGVHPGQRVVAGQRIGAVGMSGNTTGPHLHLEVLLGGRVLVDPRIWLLTRGVAV